ncbi:uncharacterized protein LOC109857794 [Pseudomyrmex gracilis]|uniref:uncharacterized protein LOC109857794 n=1 Tax=Pseudomyrmex gracilis TaxID=219809 RepID=UPI000994F7A8|nr:uncharacterized protein LOC109857794 [Pseudomyrmex gracilis]
MEEKDEETKSFDKSVNIKISEAILKEKESTSTDDDSLKSCESLVKIKLFFSKNKCPEACTECGKLISDRAQTSEYKPRTLRESSSCQKKSETKPAKKVPLSGRLKTKMEEASKTLQSALPFLETTTMRTATKVKSLYNRFRAKRVLGFKCDLNKCDNTLMECSARSCRKVTMLFGKQNHPKPIGSDNSDTSTISSTSETTREF